MYPYDRTLPTRNDLIEIHRRRYFLSAQAALRNEKEFRPPRDCGAYMQPVETHFIEGMESKLPDTRTPLEWRQFFCSQIEAGKSVPELDLRLDAYITTLRGADPPPLTLPDADPSKTNLYEIVGHLQSDYFGRFNSEQVVSHGNFVFAKLTSPDGGTINVVSLEPAAPSGCIDRNNTNLSQSELATLDIFLGPTRTWYYFFAADTNPRNELAYEHLSSLRDKRKMPESCFDAVYALITKEKLKFYYEEIAGFDVTKRSFHLVYCSVERCIMVKVTWIDLD